ncbi:MAG: hypothetical protein FJ029_15110 [Actinobacteria bacterium]|nr:hypothetical protein [Actinomycetota bacterium]
MIEWRSAQRARDLFNRGRAGVEELEGDAYLRGLLVEMARAGGKEGDWSTLRAEMIASPDPAENADTGRPPTIGAPAPVVAQA